MKTQTPIIRWANIKDGKCPKCSTDFDITTIKQGKMIRCASERCDYKISYLKYIDLLKGTKSSHYKEMVKYYKSVDRYKQKKKADYQKAIDLQNQERESNLRRMRARGSI